MIVTGGGSSLIKSLEASPPPTCPVQFWLLPKKMDRSMPGQGRPGVEGSCRGGALRFSIPVPSASWQLGWVVVLGREFPVRC